MPESQSTKRLHYVLWALLAWSGIVFGRLVWLQVIQHDNLLRMAQQQQQRTKEIPALRGAILDRTGQPLAESMPMESVCVNPRKIPDPAVAADILSRVLDLDRAEVFQKIQAAWLHGGAFLWIKRKIPAEEADRLRSLKLDWVEFRPEMRRVYPHHTLAAHVVGSMGILNPDDTVERGTGGIESKFDEVLAGRPGLAQVFTDVKQNPYDMVITRQPEPGANITLTIDPNLQYDAEKELARAIATSGAKTGSVVAVDPYNGDILAMANYPTYDPNKPPGPNDPEGARSNLAITTPFEPGSVFKVITLTAALETTHLRPDSIIDCGNGRINLFGRVIHDEHSFASMSMADVLARSDNVGAIHIALTTGDRDLYKYQRLFGFGQKTGIDLPGESAGLLRRVEDWGPSSIGSLAMGQEVSVTSLQLALAGSVIANGGLMVKPRLVISRQKPGQRAEVFPQDKPHRIIRPETAIMMRQMMEGVVLRGTGRRYATLRGYTSGGKTGTAQIYDPKIHAYTHHYNASFLGFAPVANPQIVIVATLEGTSGGPAGFGGPRAAPVFREVAMSALRMLDVPKDLPDEHAPPAPSKPDDYYDLAIAGLGNAPMGNPSLNSHSKVASSDASAVGRQPFFDTALAGPKVPDFTGMTLRAVLEESSEHGMTVETSGDPDVGLVRAQDPPAGTILPPGVHVRVQFAR